MIFSDLLTIIKYFMISFIVFINLDLTFCDIPYFECLVIEHCIFFFLIIITIVSKQTQKSTKISDFYPFRCSDHSLFELDIKSNMTIF